MPASGWNKNWSLNSSKVFTGLINITTGYYRKIIKKMFIQNNVQGKTILELGCGTSGNTFWLMREFGYCKATVVDFSKKALDKVISAKENLDIKLVNKNILNLKLKDKYDLVHSGFVIEHFYGRNRFKVIKKHAEFVGRNGYVFMEVPRKTILSLLYSKTINKINGIDELLYSKKEILELIEKADLEVVDMKILFAGSIYFILLKKVGE